VVVVGAKNNIADKSNVIVNITYLSITIII
jgi:hypothetical protein